MRVPGAPGLRLDMGEPASRRRIRDADEMLAGYSGYPGQRLRSLADRGQIVQMFSFRLSNLRPL